MKNKEIKIECGAEKLWYGDCPRCGYEFSKTRKHSEDNIEYCPDCGEPFRVVQSI